MLQRFKQIIILVEIIFYLINIGSDCCNWNWKPEKSYGRYFHKIQKINWILWTVIHINATQKSQSNFCSYSDDLNAEFSSSYRDR